MFLIYFMLPSRRDYGLCFHRKDIRRYQQIQEINQTTLLTELKA